MTSTETRRTSKRRDRIAHLIADQQRWIAEHGGSITGYVERYGSKNDPNHYGDGGEAIYAADTAELERLEQIAAGTFRRGSIMSAAAAQARARKRVQA